MTRHIHECRCGNFMVCHQERDHCPIKHFDCPVCLDRALDDYFASQLDTHSPSPKEQAREYQQRVS